MKKTKRKVAAALKGGGDIKAAMASTGLSQAQVYRYKKEIDKEVRTLNKKDKLNGGSLSEQRYVKDLNRIEAEKIIAEKHKEEINADRKNNF